MPTHRQPNDTGTAGGRPGIDEAEAILVEHYPRLVRLAYLTLPPALGRHRRVLAAHATVQRVLPGSRGGSPRDVTAARRGTGGAAYAWIRTEVLRASLAYARPTTRWRGGPASWRRPVLPLVMGLRLFPRAGGGDELALDQALSTVTAPARAALALTLLEGLSEPAAARLLARTGVDDPAAALRTAEQLASHSGGRTAKLLGTAEFDPCTVQTRPTDLLRRRRRIRLAGASVAIALVGTALAVALPDHSPARRPLTAAGSANEARGYAGTLARALDPRRLERAPGEAWADTSRVDFSVWPARGDRTGDSGLLDRALGAWGGVGRTVPVSATPGTSTVPPTRPPRLLFAGEVDGAALVVLHDGQRIARYIEPLSGDGVPALDVARADDADVTTAAAVVVSRTGQRARYLLAPWIAEAATRDLLAPDTPTRALDVSGSGVTAPVPLPAAGGDCAAWPVLQLRSSERIVERHAFLVTDLGDASPVHLTYTPPPGAGAPARQPREATGGPALVSWARTACSLRTLRGAGVRSVNNWAFAEQRLPEKSGTSTWVCTRADTWRGPGRILVQFQESGSSAGKPGTVVAEAKDTASCSRFGQHVVAGTHWKSPSGKWFLLAAGSRAVTRIAATGAVRADASGTTLAVRAPRDGDVELSARLSGTEPLRGSVGRAPQESGR